MISARSVGQRRMAHRGSDCDTISRVIAAGLRIRSPNIRSPDIRLAASPETFRMKTARVFSLCLFLLAFVSAHAAPPFYGTIFLDPDIITAADPTTFTGLTYAGRGSRSMFDRRANAFVTLNAYLFNATYTGSSTVEIQVNPEFGSTDAARAEAEKYAPVIGRLPNISRKDLRTVWIHKGFQPFGGGNNNLLIHTEQGDSYAADGILEETFVHEAAHTSLDAPHATSAGWRAAQQNDPDFISSYAAEFPDREDVAESFLPWLALRYARSRISDDLANTISATIPSRIAYFDSQNFNMAPLTLSPEPTPRPARPLNVSTRLNVRTGENVMIGGFIITGNAAKKVIIRAIGPSLQEDGVTGALGDPTLKLHGPDGPIAENDDWTQSDQAAEIVDSGVSPRNNLESAIVASLPSGKYTAIVRGVNQATGIGLVEVYDLDQSADALLANISTRGFVEAGENVMIGGFILGGGSLGSRVVVRAIGPSLKPLGVADALGDPTLALHDSNGEKINSNDNWKQNEQTGASQEAEVQATGVPPSSDLEAAIVTELPAGNYTAIVRGKANGTGVGLVEVYALQ